MEVYREMNRANNFTLCHFIGAVMVIFGHQWELMCENQPGGVLGLNIHGAGVYILFACSGYLISNSYKRSDTIKAYVQRRCLRIILPLLLCMFFTGTLGYLIKAENVSGTSYAKGYLYYLIRNMCFWTYSRLPGVFTHNPFGDVVNGSLWSLAPEILCYMLVPVICKNSRRLWVVLATCACTLLYSISCYDIIKIKNEHWLGVILCFFIGVTVNQLQLEKYLNLQAAIVMGCLVSCCSLSFYPVINMFVVCYIALSLAMADNPIFMNAVKVDINYELYLYAFPIQQLIIEILRVRNNIFISGYYMFVLSFGCTVAVSFIMNALDKRLRNMLGHLGEEKHHEQENKKR